MYEIKKLEGQIEDLMYESKKLEGRIEDLNEEIGETKALLNGILEELGLSPTEIKMAIQSSDPRSRILSMVRESILDAIDGVSYAGQS